jgi:hypothetical protein
VESSVFLSAQFCGLVGINEIVSLPHSHIGRTACYGTTMEPLAPHFQKKQTPQGILPGAQYEKWHGL